MCLQTMSNIMHRLTAHILRDAVALVTLIVCTIHSSHLFAVEVGTFDQFRENDTFMTYLDGVGKGWLWANAKLDSKKQPLLFCVPPTLSLTADNYIHLIDAKIKAARAQGGLNEKAPIELILLAALEEAFPCKK